VLDISTKESYLANAMAASDGQFSTHESVCIDPDATALGPTHLDKYPNALISGGSLECLDEPDWVFRYDSHIIFSCF